MQIAFFIALAFFVVASILDYRSSVKGIEANPLVRGKDGKISRVKFFIYVGAALALALIAYLVAGSLVIANIILLLGGIAHLFAKRHNDRIMKG